MASKFSGPGGGHAFVLFRRRVAALCLKEFVQALRDPSALLIVFVFPPLLLSIFAYGVSLDQGALPLGVVQQAEGSRAQELESALRSDDGLLVDKFTSRAEAERAMDRGEIKGYLIIPADFSKRLSQLGTPTAQPLVQVITDGSQNTNAVSLLANSVLGNVELWLGQQRGGRPGVSLEPRFWYNPELDSRRIFVPGSITIVMTMIATLLTSLVIAREWERGTMEALMASPVSGMGILIGKLVPYFVLAMVASLMLTGLSLLWFRIPFRGSLPALLLVYSAFLVPGLAQGLLISAVTRNQLLASQLALLTGFLPAMLLSGFVFEISSMPMLLRWFTVVIPATHLINSLRSLFLVGDLWPMLWRDSAMMLALGLLLFAVASKRSHKTLERG